MLSFGMIGCVAFVSTDVSEEPVASIIKLTRIGELGTMLAVTSDRCGISMSSDPGNEKGVPN
jgi:hypothetical protein